jgi:rhomboid protease GluP
MQPMLDSRRSAALGVTPDRGRADEWQLALASAGIDSRLDWSTSGYVVLVRPDDRAHAHAVLSAFEAENPRPAPAPPQSSTPGTSRAALLVAVLLCGFFVVTGPRDAGEYWFDRGAADAARIAAGEPWRVVTALTLHADFLHIISNAITLVIFGSALCGLVGPGVGISVMLLSGAMGNWLTALLRGPHHNAVGASTAVFGGLGALATIQLVRRRAGAPISTWRAAAPLAAGLGLLGFLGTAPQADVLAHLFGFVVGAGLGLVVVRLGDIRERALLQTGLAVATAAIVAASWVLAIT